jgi:hypothetical protein
MNNPAVITMFLIAGLTLPLVLVTWATAHFAVSRLTLTTKKEGK